MNLLALATSITIDLMDLLLGLLIIVGILLGVYLIILLARLGGAVKKLSVLVDEIDGPVTETIKDLPGLMKLLRRDSYYGYSSVNSTVPM